VADLDAHEVRRVPDLTIRIDDLVGEGDRVVWRITASGTHNGNFQGVPATGKSVKFGAGTPGPESFPEDGSTANAR
jgi:predicted ester cyclase